MNGGPLLDYYRREYDQRQDGLPGFHLAWVRRDREDAMARFMATGLPGRGMEGWKYTAPPLQPDHPMALANPTCIGLDPEDLAPLLMQRRLRQHLVFVNGHFSRSLSNTTALPEGVWLAGLASQLIRDPEEALAGFSSAPVGEDQGFSHLNRALWRDGVFLRVGAGVRLEQPLQLLFIATETADPLLLLPRNVLVVERGAVARVVESHLCLGKGSHLTNAWGSLLVEEGGHLHHTILVEGGESARHVATLRATLAANSRLDAGLFALGGGLSRQELWVELAERGARCHLTGLFAATAGQQVDFQVHVRHCASATTSHQAFRGVLDGQARGIFNGVVRVPPGVEKIVSSQTTRNLLLSSQAEIDAKPQLEIHASDVQCTHGATVGQLDEEALFYLRSRGMDLATARRLLVGAFVGEILQQLEPEVLRGWVTGRFEQWRMGS